MSEHDFIYSIGADGMTPLQVYRVVSHPGEHGKSDATYRVEVCQ
ncbi:MAG TPA: hypothetical protein PKD55_10800 [Bellilinea sp.]|nr:hypothetical protein [Bellilinea sp.]